MGYAPSRCHGAVSATIAKRLRGFVYGSVAGRRSLFQHKLSHTQLIHRRRADRRQVGCAAMLAVNTPAGVGHHRRRSGSFLRNLSALTGFETASRRVANSASAGIHNAKAVPRKHAAARSEWKGDQIRLCAINVRFSRAVRVRARLAIWQRRSGPKGTSLVCFNPPLLQ